MRAWQRRLATKTLPPPLRWTQSYRVGLVHPKGTAVPHAAHVVSYHQIGLPQRGHVQRSACSAHHRSGPTSRIRSRFETISLKWGSRA